MNYYNDNDPFAAAWLRGLIKAGLLPEGDVDERSIVDVRGADLDGYAQYHFFAGIGGWPYALAFVGWPEDEEVWTGSCPCQPFSVAGKGEGTGDKRHLWPEFHRLISECRPPVVFGEQVASKAGRIWLAGVRADLEGVGYGVGAADLCAAGIGAPHIRQRLFWVADTERRPAERQRLDVARAEKDTKSEAHKREWIWADPGDGRADGGAADTEHDGSHREGWPAAQPDGDGEDGRLHRGSARWVGLTVKQRLEGLARDGHDGNEPGWEHAESCGPVAAPGRHAARWVADAISKRGRGGDVEGKHAADVEPPSAVNWARSGYVLCGDGKARRAPLEPSLFPLANGLPGRVGLLRGAGNAIVPPLAAEFIRAYRDIA